MRKDTTIYRPKEGEWRHRITLRTFASWLEEQEKGVIFTQEEEAEHRRATDAILEYLKAGAEAEAEAKVSHLPF
jgi:hypothetical protein